jgi:hypothetical protein
MLCCSGFNGINSAAIFVLKLYNNNNYFATSLLVSDNSRGTLLLFLIYVLNICSSFVPVSYQPLFTGCFIRFGRY